MVTVKTAPSPPKLTVRAIAGVSGGVVGGVAFGVLMHVTDMLPMVAQLVDSDAVAVGWLVHLFNSALFGAIFAVLLGRKAAQPVIAAAAGLVYGFVWWLLGALMIMPAWLGMSEMIFEVGADQWRSLLGHLIYGVLLGLVTSLVIRRSVQRS
jgi:uncharacterized membrane protein YagU involved in acid resistance